MLGHFGVEGGDVRYVGLQGVVAWYARLCNKGFPRQIWAVRFKDVRAFSIQTKTSKNVIACCKYLVGYSSLQHVQFLVASYC